MAQCPYAVNLYGEGRQCPETSEGFSGCYVWGSGCPIRAGGEIYSNSMTMEDDDATRFETEIKTLRYILINVQDKAMLLGSEGEEVYLVEDFTTIKLVRTDISTLYFKNSQAGMNGTIMILGVADPRE